MPSFDVVSEVDMHEVTNALDQANKEVTNRFDLKATGSKCQQADNVITVVSDSDFHLEQVVQVLMQKLAARYLGKPKRDLLKRLGMAEVERDLWGAQ